MQSTIAAEREEKRRFWEDHLSRWEAGGLSQSAYCRENQLKLHRFTYWKMRLSPGAPAVSLVEWPGRKRMAVPLFSFAPPLCLVMDGGYRLEIHKGCDPELLESVVRVIRDL